MKSIARKTVFAFITIAAFWGCNIASVQANEKAEIYLLLIQANVMHDLDMSFTFNSKSSKSSCASLDRTHAKSFTIYDSADEHDCPLDFVCVAELISYCAENYGSLECDDDGCSCYVC